jgi:heterodisulfide reductase subunit A
MEEPRVGVYVCHCGGNISDVVDVEKVTAYAARLEGVTVARHYPFMCSNPGQALIEDDIGAGRVNRVVVASCSPRLHENTFRKALARAGLNPYLFEHANVREQCSWAHGSEPERATEKAGALIRMAVAKARLLEPLASLRLPVVPEALVVGGGAAGLRASLDLAERGFAVHLIEETPFLGGRLAQLYRVYPTDEDAQALLGDLLERVVRHPRVRMYPGTTVQAVEGVVGNWVVRLWQKPRCISEACNSCGRCVEACPVTVSDAFNYGLGTRKAIYLPYPDAYPPRYAVDLEACTRCGACASACPEGAVRLEEPDREFELRVGAIVIATGFTPYEPAWGEYGYGLHPNVITLPQLVRLLSPHGPTRGYLRLGNREIRNVVVISCVGSRQTPRNGEKVNKYCSRYCCSASLAAELELKRRLPGASVYHLYRDIRTYARNAETLYERAGASGVLFLRYAAEEPPVVVPEGDTLLVRVRDQLTFGEEIEIPADLVVLATGMVPGPGVADLAARMKLPVGEDGFLLEVHPKLRPVEMPVDGIFVAGTAQGPKDLTETACSASAAAAKAAILLSRAEVERDPFLARVDATRCTGCGVCLPECDYGALRLLDAERRVVVEEAMCKGCGSCAAVCPEGALAVRGYTIEQLAAMVEAAIAGEGEGDYAPAIDRERHAGQAGAGPVGAVARG